MKREELKDILQNSYSQEKWIKTFGDPRRKQIDAIDFIELIPFHETRNYVQRVSENINVYEYLSDPGNATNKIEKILYR